MFVLSGPGGVGKGTIATRLVAADERLVLSRSWTTRAQRPGEPSEAYHFVSRVQFEQRIADDGFLEWNEFLGNLYGTPLADPPPGRDLLLEIDVNGAVQVRRRRPDAVVIFVDAPTVDDLVRRMRARGDPEERIEARVREGPRERQQGRDLDAVFVVNDDLDSTVDEILGVIEKCRAGGNGG